MILVINASKRAQRFLTPLRPAEENGKIISVTIVNSKPNDPEVLTILKSIKVK